MTLATKADHTLRPIGSNFWRRLLGSADRAVSRAYRRHVLPAFNRLIDNTNMSALERAVSDNNVEAAYLAIPWKTFLEDIKDFHDDVLIPLVNEGIEVAKDELDKELRKQQEDPVLAYAQERAREWSEGNSARLVVGISLPAEQAIREIIAEAIRSGEGVKTTARKIRQHIGLTPQQSTALANYRMQLEKVFAEEASLSALNRRYRLVRVTQTDLVRRTVNDLVDRYHRSQIRWRAEVISRQETLHSTRVGQQLYWESAVNNNLIEADRWEREWVTTIDDRRCETCEEMDGERAEIGGTYRNAYEYAEAHILCRCSERLVRRQNPGQS